MKYLSRFLAVLSMGLLMVACSDHEDGAVTHPLQVSTPVVSQVRSGSALIKATASGSHITYRGFCYSTSANPTIDDMKMTSTAKDMQVVLLWLTKNTTYYVRAFAQTNNQVKYSDVVSFTTADADEEISLDDGEQTLWPSQGMERVSVHDPSIVWDHTSGDYYIFGSHRASAKTSNLLSWTAFTAPWQTATSNNALNTDAFTTPVLTSFTKGGQQYELNFDALAWSGRGNDSYDISGNMWAPDVIYNKEMRKWCMYLSINGDSWYSSVIMLTADRITGPYRYQAPIVMSGARSNEAYNATDMPIVLGESSLPARYNPSDSYGNHWPNAIDPCVFYDEEGDLWMSYGSWSGGIFMLQLDEKTGLRDYDVTYETNDYSDPYFGKKISGGWYASGEASYIEHIGDYYYLFVTNGGLTADGGYQMRYYRSLNADGPYVDSKGSAALLSARETNYGPGDSKRGVNIFGAYGEWGGMAVGNAAERSQGHNSVLAGYDGRAYLVYHTRFQNQGEGHAVRVHQLFINEEGWLVAAPFEYTGEVMHTANIARKQYVATNDIPGAYKLLIHNYGLDHANKALSTPVDITLNADGTISGSQTGTWSVREGTSFVTIKLGSAEYKGVMVPQTLEPSDTQVPAFTCLRSQSGVTIWGYKQVAE